MLVELTPLEQTRAYQEIVRRNQHLWKEEVRKEGRQEGGAQMVQRQLKRRLGKVSETQQKKIQALPVNLLEELGEALLDFENSADLNAWLKANPPPKAD